MKIQITDKMQPLGAKGFIYTISDPEGNFLCKIREQPLKDLLPMVNLSPGSGLIFTVEQMELCTACIVWGGKGELIAGLHYEIEGGIRQRTRKEHEEDLIKSIPLTLDQQGFNL